MRIILKGQIRGGKNNMGVTRTGVHYPKPEFVLWRARTMNQIMEQRPAGFKKIDNSNWHWDFVYTPTDKRRRDIPAILDAIFHCLERTGVIADDYFVQNMHFRTNAVSKDGGMIIDIVEVKAITEVVK